MVTYLPPVPPKKNIWGRIGAAAGEGFEKGADAARQEALAGRRLEQEYKLREQLEMQKLGAKEQSKAAELAGKQRIEDLSQDIITKKLRGEEVSPEEDAFLLKEKPQSYKALQTKNAPGGLSGQPVDPEISSITSKIIQTFPDADADTLKMLMDKAGVPPANSNPYVENRRRQDERMQASKDKRLESGQKRAEKVLDKADILGEELPILEASVSAMEDAIINGDQSFWSSDNLAELTGLEFFRTAKGAQFKTAAKTFFINDLKASGARPNMFIEKQFVDALAKVGRSQEANQAVIESFKFTNDLKRKRLETTRELEKYYDESLGYLPGRFAAIVEDTMAPYIKDRQKEYERRLRDLAVQEKKNSEKKQPEQKLSGRLVDVTGPDGKEYEVDESEVELLPEGYRLK